MYANEFYVWEKNIKNPCTHLSCAFIREQVTKKKVIVRKRVTPVCRCVNTRHVR